MITFAENEGVMSSTIKCWIEAMRLRTLPVSLAGVTMGVILAYASGVLQFVPTILCYAFALLAQISSNFANEYFDWRDGLDKAGREGPRRGVTEGDIAPRVMLAATLATLGAACVAGCALIAYGGWLLLPVGIFTALGALAYSAGPWPLSRHALGEVAVVIFFGLVPVTFVYYIMSHRFPIEVILSGLAMGLMSANILIVNNYRDADDDRSVGKTTLAVKCGRRFSSWLYLFNGLAGIALLSPEGGDLGGIVIVPAVIYLVGHVALWRAMTARVGRQLNPLLGLTAMNLLVFTLLEAIVVVAV